MFGFLEKKQSILEAGLLGRAVDNHCHILYGLDDGIRTVEDSLEALAFLEKEGVRKVWLTPHTMEDVPNTTAEIQQRFQELLSVYKGKLELAISSEYMIDTLFEERLANRDLLLHGEDLVLVETSTWNPPINLWEVLEKMMKAGYRPLIAHPERYRYMKKDDYKRLHDMGALMQLNIPSIVGYYGDGPVERAMDLLEKGWYSVVGTDCHRLGAVQKQLGSKVLKKDVIAEIRTLIDKDC